MHSKSANSKDRGRYNQQLGHLHHLHGNELRQKSDATPFLQPTACADYDATAAFCKYSCWWCFENVTENMNNNYVLPYVGLSCQHFCTTQTPKITKSWWHCFQVGKHYLATPAGFLSHCPWVPWGSSPILTRSSPAVSLSDSTSKSLSIEGKLSPRWFFLENSGAVLSWIPKTEGAGNARSCLVSHRSSSFLTNYASCHCWVFMTIASTCRHNVRAQEDDAFSGREEEIGRHEEFAGKRW